MSNSPLVSVITASHRPDPGFLMDAYLSLLSQDLTSWEWRLILDGDESLRSQVPQQILQDERCHVDVTGMPVGSGCARNVALGSAQGPFLVNLDADDVFLPTSLTLLTRALLENPDVGVVFGLHQQMDEKGVPIPGSTSSAPYPPGRLEAGVLTETWLRTSHHHTATSHNAYRRSAVFAAGGWGALRISQDLHMMLMVADVSPAFFIDEVLGHYRQHSGQVTKNADERTWVHSQHFIASYLLHARAQRGIPVPDWSYLDRSGTLRSVIPAQQPAREGSTLTS